MKQTDIAAFPRFTGYTILALVTGGLAGLTLAAWVSMGPDMFMALIESGLATCF